MAASEPFQYIELNENEVPGAKFVYESIEKHSNTQLSRWLECRGLCKTGNRSEILKRVHSCISAGKDKEIDVGVDCGKWYELKKESKLQLAGVPSRVPLLPYCGWGKFPSCQEKMPKLFNKGHIHHHIVESVQFVNAKDVSDESDDDIEDLHTAKPMQKGLKFFESGHVKKMQDCVKSEHYFLKSKVMASMRTNVEYDVTVTLSVHSGFVKDASCTCIASAMGRCSHVTGLLYALENFLSLSGKDLTSCTSLPCTWNRGRQKQKNPKRVQELSYSSKKT
ncbi:uncharacterized protein LOC128557300 [Mercenaria mercenaria]|uniref:uncharacterized protein LOC128557300 n=1 Tax=Mercenaria mercenaria TaxID=6596 RepID=UPI00234E596D|nr:uncharacterized protein LOC128557300 [Mercenaria mercenaria]